MVLDLPVPGSDIRTWGHKVNAALESLEQYGIDTLSTAAAANSKVDGLVKAAVPLRGAGIDPTGATDSRAAVQALLNANAGKAVQVIPGDVINIAGQIEVPAGTTLLGPGEIRATAGFEHSSAIRLRSNTTLRGVTLTNPNMVISGNSGGRSYGVSIQGNDVLVEGNTVDGFENGIAATTGGEYHNHRIIGNRVKDVLGWRDFESNNGTTGGEDRGDGIVTWGAGSVIIGNIVNAKAGFDARIGIHAESLKSDDDTPSPFDDRVSVIQGNIVYGKFRRGITAEETKQVTIVGNFIQDSTWWGISVILGEGHVVAHNTIRWTRTSSDTQGSNYSPVRGPVAILKGSLGTVVQGNTIVHADGSSASGSIMLYSEGADDQPVDCMILDNNIQVVGTGSVQDGIRSDGLNFTRPVIRGNFISGFTRHGINMYTVDSPVVESNIIRGKGSSTTGYVKQNGGGSFGMCRFNHITGCSVGISASSVATGGVIENNYIDTATAFFFGGTPTGNRVASNKFGPNVGTYSFPSGSNNFLFNNLELQGTTTWQPTSSGAATGTVEAGKTATVTLTVTGAAVGNSNLVLVGAPYTLKGCQVTGYVSTANVVTIVISNLTGSDQTFASGTWKAQILGR